jgi:hypothetical protein
MPQVVETLVRQARLPQFCAACVPERSAGVFPILRSGGRYLFGGHGSWIDTCRI